MNPALVVSLHDVSPLTQPVFAKILAELKALGIPRCSLLVIPDHHGRGNMLDDPGFCRWLEGLSAGGHELVVHGYYHRRTQRPAENLVARAITRVYTQGEGEFYDLDRAQAAGLLERALADFSRLNVPRPQGFIAPAWLLGADAEAAVRAAGFRYTTRLTEVEDLIRGTRTHARSLVYSCRNGWRLACSLAWNGALEVALRAEPLLRLSLHPPDFEHPRVWQQIWRIAERAAAERETLTYAAFVDGIA